MDLEYGPCCKEFRNCHCRRITVFPVSFSLVPIPSHCPLLVDGPSVVRVKCDATESIRCRDEIEFWFSVATAEHGGLVPTVRPGSDKDALKSCWYKIAFRNAVLEACMWYVGHRSLLLATCNIIVIVAMKPCL